MVKSVKSVSKSDSKINFDSINYKELLTKLLTEKGTISAVYSAFYTYSFQNQCLAMWQLEKRGMGITPVLPKSKWAEKGRTVKDNAEPIYLCQPRLVKYEKEELNKETGKKEKVEKSFTKFIYSPLWYSYDQTSGKDLLAEPSKLPNFDFDKALAKFKIELVDYNSLDGNCQGYALVKENKIALNPMAGHKDMTLLHEMAHCLLRHADIDFHSFRLVQLKFKLEKELQEKYDYEKADKQTKKELDVKIKKEIENHKRELEARAKSYEHCLKEVEAEATAFIIGSILGIDEETLSDSRGYVQNWFGSHKNIPEENSQRIIRTVDKMLKVGLVKS